MPGREDRREQGHGQAEQSHEQGMIIGRYAPRWEYRTLAVFDDAEDIAALVDAGYEGWEAYAVHPLAQDGSYIYFMKRLKGQ